MDTVPEQTVHPVAICADASGADALSCEPPELMINQHVSSDDEAREGAGRQGGWLKQPSTRAARTLFSWLSAAKVWPMHTNARVWASLTVRL